MELLKVLKRIERVVNDDERLKKKSDKVRECFIGYILDMYEELERDEERARRRTHSSLENLKFAIVVNLHDDFDDILNDIEG